MRKQYMDFVPTKLTGQVDMPKPGRSARSMDVRSPRGLRASDFVATRKSVNLGASTRAPVGPSGKSMSVKNPARRPATTRASIQASSQQRPVLGMIEDSSTKFVKTDVPKRPLGDRSHFVTHKTGVSAIKAQKVGVRKASEMGAVKRDLSVSQANKKDRMTGGVAAKRGVGGKVAVGGSATGKNAVGRSVAGKNATRKNAAATFKTPKTPFINQNKVQKRPLSKNVYPKKVPVATKEPSGPVTIISKPEKQARISLIVTIVLTVVLGAAAGVIAFLLLPK